MKQLLLWSLLLLITHSVFAQASTSEQDVQQTVVKAFDALSARDAEALRKLCTTDVRFNEYGEAWPIHTLIRKAITKNTAADFKRTNTLDFLTTTVKGDVAWTTYNLHSVVTANSKNVEVYWMETVIAVREDKKWKIKVLHSTRVNKN